MGMGDRALGIWPEIKGGGCQKKKKEKKIWQ